MNNKTHLEYTNGQSIQLGRPKEPIQNKGHHMGTSRKANLKSLNLGISPKHTGGQQGNK